MRLPLLLPFVALCAIGTFPLAAQTANVPQSRDKSTLNVEFKGGSLAEYLEALRGNGEHNIVIPEKANLVPVRPLSLKNVTVGNAIEVVAKTLERDRFQVSTSSVSGPGSPVYAVHVEERAGKNPREAEEKANATRVFSVREIIELPPGMTDAGGMVMTAQTVLSAIKIGIKIATTNEDKTPPTIQFHEESGLLFVQGQAWAAELVKSILREMETDLKTRRAAAKPAASRPQEPKVEKGEKLDKE